MKRSFDLFRVIDLHPFEWTDSLLYLLMMHPNECVTTWLDYFSIFGHLQQLKLPNNVTNLPK